MSIKPVTKYQSDHLYRCMKVIHDIFMKHRIPYWLVGGTLLGAVRHSGRIDHDDDNDICILDVHVEALSKLGDEFEEKGYELESNQFDKQENGQPATCNKKKNSCGWYVNPLKMRGKTLGTDIFVMERKGNKLLYKDPQWNGDGGNNNCYFLYDHTFPLKAMKFGNFYVLGPNKPIHHLNNCYGNDWNSHSKMMMNHRTGEWENEQKHEMKSHEYKTKKPPIDTCDPMVPIMYQSCEVYQHNTNYDLPLTTKELPSPFDSELSFNDWKAVYKMLLNFKKQQKKVKK